MELGREWAVRGMGEGLVGHGSVSKFGFGKLMRGRFLPQNPDGQQQPLMANSHPDLKRSKRLLRKMKKK